MARNRVMHTRGAKRKSLWLQFKPLSATVGAQSLIFSLNAAALALRPFTIVRTHFSVLMFSDQAAAVEQQNGAIGLAVVSDEAVAVGITAVPTPLAQLGSSLWFAHQLLMSQSSHQVDLTLPPGRWEIDSKAQRKVEVGSDVIVVMDNETIGGSATYIAFVGGRILIKTN